MKKQDDKRSNMNKKNATTRIKKNGTETLTHKRKAMDNMTSMLWTHVTI